MNLQKRFAYKAISLVDVIDLIKVFHSSLSLTFSIIVPVLQFAYMVRLS